MLPIDTCSTIISVVKNNRANAATPALTEKPVASTFCSPGWSSSTLQTHSAPSQGRPIVSSTNQVAIDYLDSLDFEDGNYINSHYSRKMATGCWDSWLRGAGPPPIKTPKGWLLLYHAMDYSDPGRYKLGAMILDSQDPTKVLFRSKSPLIEPNETYENEGFKAGVVYACGAVIKNKNLMIYYGGADTVVCAARLPIHDLLENIEVNDPSRLEPISGKIH